MSQPSIDAERGEMESRGYEWNGEEWVKRPHLTASDLDLILLAYDRKSTHYKTRYLIKPDPYYLRMLKKIDMAVCEILARYHNQKNI